MFSLSPVQNKIFLPNFKYQEIRLQHYSETPSKQMSIYLGLRECKVSVGQQEVTIT
jgi:hypothetical protein